MRLEVLYTYSVRAANHDQRKLLTEGSKFHFVDRLSIEIPELSSKDAPDTLVVDQPDSTMGPASQVVWKKQEDSWMVPLRVKDCPHSGAFSAAHLEMLAQAGFSPFFSAAGTVMLWRRQELDRAIAGSVMRDAMAKNWPGSFVTDKSWVEQAEDSRAAAEEEQRRDWEEANICLVDGQCWHRVPEPVFTLTKLDRLGNIHVDVQPKMNRYVAREFPINAWSELEAAAKEISGGEVPCAVRWLGPEHSYSPLSM